MSTVITKNNPFATCPACKKEIVAEYELDFGELKFESSGDASLGQATVTLRGVRISHDCFSKKTREIQSDRNRKYHTEEELRLATEQPLP